MLPPLEGVRKIPLTVTAKESMFVPGGGVNGMAANVALTVALPFWTQLTVHCVLGPLQEEMAKTAGSSGNRKRRALKRIIRHPTLD